MQPRPETIHARDTARILIADDHEMIRVGLRTILGERENWSIVEEARDGEEALRLATQTEPNIAVIDYQLPFMNGLEVTCEIRKRLPGTKVVIFTIHDELAMVAMAFEAGARGYVTKSEANTHLLLAIETLISDKPYLSARIAAKLARSFLDGPQQGNRLTPGARVALRLKKDGHSDPCIASALDLPVNAVETFCSRVQVGLI